MIVGLSCGALRARAWGALMDDKPTRAQPLPAAEECDRVIPRCQVCGVPIQCSSMGVWSHLRPSIPHPAAPCSTCDGAGVVGTIVCVCQDVAEDGI